MTAGLDGFRGSRPYQLVGIGLKAYKHLPVRLRLTNPSTSPNELNTTLMPHSIIPGDACFAYFNKIWGIPASPPPDWSVKRRLE
jgi:hypothetical protein